MPDSLCLTCQAVRVVTTPKGSRFLLCTLSATHPELPKYPPQPVIHCNSYQPARTPEPPADAASRQSDSPLVN